MNLCRAGQQRWTETRRYITTAANEKNDLFGGFPHGFHGGLGQFGVPFGFPGRQQPSGGNRARIEDHWQFTMDQLASDKAVINTKLSSQRISDDGRPLGDAQGEGQFTFDRKRNVISRGYTNVKLQLLNADGTNVAVPLQLSYMLREVLTDKQINDRMQKQQKEIDQHQTEEKAENERKLSGAIATLKKGSSDPNALRRALDDLAFVGNFLNQSPLRDEVAAQLNRYLKSSDDSIRSEAISATEKWATPANIPVLLEILPLVDQFKRGQVLKALGTTGGNEKAATIAAGLLETSAHGDATEALKNMKKYAEPVVLPLLKTSDRDVFSDACKILGEVGGQKSRDALQDLLDANAGKKGFNEFGVKDALDKVKQRIAVNGG